MKHIITTRSRRRSATMTRRRQKRTPTRRRPAPLAQQTRWLVFWHLKRGIVRPCLVTLVLLLVWGVVLWLGVAHLLHAWPVAQAAPLPGATSARPTPKPVSSPAQRVPVLYQGDASIGWDSPQQYHAWWPSACAPAALTEVLRAWGTHVGIGPVLDKLVADHVITLERGLLDANALAAVAHTYGDQAVTFWRWNEAQVAQVTSQGVPVLVDVVDAHQQTAYPALVTGHWLVVVSVSPTQIAVRDSSSYHIKTLIPSLFHTLFTGVAVVVWQGKLALR